MIVHFLFYDFEFSFLQVLQNTGYQHSRNDFCRFVFAHFLTVILRYFIQFSTTIRAEFIFCIKLLFAF